jgi:N-acetylglucosamine-6-sulfatase
VGRSVKSEGGIEARRSRVGRWLAAAVAIGLALGLGLVSPALTSAQPPNIIVVQTDDQNNGTVNERVMPSVVRLLGGVGTTFDDYIDSGPLCCPSRAVMLTGQYGHNNGVLWNEPHPYADLRGKKNTLPVWLHQAGYVTAHLGKYLKQLRAVRVGPE